MWVVFVCENNVTTPFGDINVADVLSCMYFMVILSLMFYCSSIDYCMYYDREKATPFRGAEHRKKRNNSDDYWIARSPLKAIWRGTMIDEDGKKKQGSFHTYVALGRSGNVQGSMGK